MNNVVQLKRPKPRTFDSREKLIDDLREHIFLSGLTYKVIAERAKVSEGTVARLAQGYTGWPRATTIFPLLDVLHLGLTITAAR